MPSKPSEESCGGPAAKACSIGLAIFLVGGVLGLILFLTDGGGVIVDVITGGAPSSTSVVGPSSPAQLLDPTCAEDIEERGGAGGGRTGSKCELCKAGFWGANCTACPLCGTHGTCSGSGTTSGTGACACAPGWTTSSGSSGSLQQCDACALGYFGPDCAPCAACSGHGTCADSGTHGTDGSCVCVSSNDTNTGRTTSFAGADCSTCAPGHYGSTCASCTVDCGEHGACADGMQGDGRCRCNPGFTGDACESCAPGVGWAPSSNVPQAWPRAKRFGRWELHGVLGAWHAQYHDRTLRVRRCHVDRARMRNQSVRPCRQARRTVPDLRLQQPWRMRRRRHRAGHGPVPMHRQFCWRIVPILQAWLHGSVLQRCMP